LAWLFALVIELSTLLRIDTPLPPVGDIVVTLCDISHEDSRTAKSGKHNNVAKIGKILSLLHGSEQSDASNESRP
jgi:hypothetical protein